MQTTKDRWRWGISKKFELIACTLEFELAPISSVHAMEEHWAYEELVSMGWPVVPLLIDMIVESPSVYWLTALYRITGHNPIEKGNEGVIYEMARNWLTWWHTKGEDEYDQHCRIL